MEERNFNYPERMNISEELMRNLKLQAAGLGDTPKHAYLSFVPTQVKSKVIHMKGKEWTPKSIPTLYICSISKIYTEEMCDHDMVKWNNFFGINELLHLSDKIKLFPMADSPEAVDTFRAIGSVNEILLKLNQLPEKTSIRIVVLGVAHSSFPHQAIEYLLREWSEPDKNPRTVKDVEFFTAGDTGSHIMEQFCKWMCISGVCTNLVFVNTQEYHPFGSVKREFND